MNKKERRNLIKNIISHQIIQTQSDLVKQINLKGNVVTQATISRDIKEMHLIKIPFKNNQYRYSLSYNNDIIKLYDMLKESLISIHNYDAFIFLTTLPGSGPSISDLIDKAKYHHIIFNISNDNKVLIVCDNKNNAYKVKNEFYKQSHKKNFSN